MSEEDEPTQQGGLGASQSTRSAWTHSSRFRSLLGGSSSGKGRRSRSVPAVDTFAAGLAEDAGGSSAAGPRPMPRGLGSGSRLSGLGRWLSSRRSRGTMSGSQTTFDEDGLRDTFDMNFRELMPFSSAAAQAIGSYSKRVLFTSLAIIWGYNILCLALYRQVFEQHWTMLDAAEFMAATVHTVGYGNLQPSSQGSRMFTIFTAIFGLLIAAHLVAGLQGAFHEQNEKSFLQAKKEIMWRSMRKVSRRASQQRIQLHQSQRVLTSTPPSTSSPLAALAEERGSLRDSGRSTIQSEVGETPTAFEIAGPELDADHPSAACRVCKELCEWLCDVARDLCTACLEMRRRWFPTRPARLMRTLVRLCLVFALCGLIFWAIEQHCEEWGYEDCRDDLGYLDWIYFSVITGSTIGYGDIVPATKPGRILNLFFIPFGVLFMADELGGIGIVVFGQREEEKLKVLLNERITPSALNSMGNADGRVTEAQFIEFMLTKSTMVPEETFNDMRAQFQAMDLDNDGEITMADLIFKAVQEADPSVRKSAVEAATTPRGNFIL